MATHVLSRRKPRVPRWHVGVSVQLELDLRGWSARQLASEGDISLALVHAVLKGSMALHP